MKIAAWNVNSLNVRLPHVLDWLQSAAPDVLCLQELKLEDAKFPLEAINEAGYNAVFDGQKTYNGVAILSKTRAEDVVKGIPGYADEQKRVIAATVEGLRIVCVYVPNGQSVDSDKYRYKLEWLGALTRYLETAIGEFPELAVGGDYNIAPEDRDVHDPKAWVGQVLCSGPERAAFASLAALGLKDSFRLFAQPEASFSWWDYRMNAFRRKMGLRIDHILLTPPLASRCTAASIDTLPRTWERPSDHAPVLAQIA
jgi:exodeoxyribonuclease III